MTATFIVRSAGASVISVQLADEISLNADTRHYIEISQVNIPFTIKNITENESIDVSLASGETITFTLLPGTYAGSDITERFSSWCDRNGLDGSIELFFDSCVDKTCVRFDSTVKQVTLSETLRQMFGYADAVLVANASGLVTYSEFISEERPKITDDILEFYISTDLNTNSYTDSSSDKSYSTIANVLFHGYFNAPNSMNTFNSEMAMPVEISSDSIYNFNLNLVDANFQPLTPGLPWTIFFTIM
jgi:hypothetical protein